jgi:agmatine deiminase
MADFLVNLDGFELPPEWCPHEATWLSWLHNSATWPKSIFREVLPVYKEFIAFLACDEKVCLNIKPNSGEFVHQQLVLAGVNMSNIELFEHHTNDSWCRDYGPDFLVNYNSKKKLVLDWKYNSWGGKYPPFLDDNLIPEKIAEVLSLPRLSIDMVLEGGSFDVNGEGVLLTTESCLLNINRNPRFSKKEIEKKLKHYLRQKEVVWLKQGIVGDDTDGHVDDIARFVSKDQILVGATHPKDENYSVLSGNKSFLLDNYKERFELIDLPMPSKLLVEGVLTPASYCNFYIANNKVIVPIFNDPNDKEALSILAECFPTREVIGLNSSKIIYGLGSFHCLSKQEPKN